MSAAKTLAVIPARYASTRFPGKPLIDIGGQTMIERVYRQVRKAAKVNDVIVATDDDRIVKAVLAFNGKVELTSSGHTSGTDRCAEVAERFRELYDLVINIQGDEPFINPDAIDSVCHAFTRPDVDIASLCKKIDDEVTLWNPNVVKVVNDTRGFALYFSRHPIPFSRNSASRAWQQDHTYFKHLGIYGFRTDTLVQLTKLPTGKLEKAESLEQLRWLENGYSIHMTETRHETLAIDSPADLEHVEKYLKSHS